jgi:ADP-ribosylglycohydrolase
MTTDAEPVSLDRTERFHGLLLGATVGDALGLPMEGLRASRARRMYPGPLRHRFFLGRGMISDDTEHLVFVCQSLLEHPDCAEKFTQSLGWSFRWWLAAIPAGVGFATLRACLRLWIGIPPDRSGVHSAGNGPAMRMAPIGAFFSHDEDACSTFVSAATRITHTDPRALTGARVVAFVAGWIARNSTEHRPPVPEMAAILRAGSREDDEWASIVSTLERAMENEESVEALAHRLGLEDRVSGYVFHTVPVSVFAWYRHYGNFEATIESVIRCGGDTDTSAAIAGALAGMTVGPSRIPAAWRDDLTDWPRGGRLLHQLALRLGQDETLAIHKKVSYRWYFVPFRNLFFLVLVLTHGLRRLFPPY